MQTFWDNVLRVVAVIGLIAVLLLGAWGIIQLAFMLPSFFSGLGGSGNKAVTAQALTVSVPAAVTATQPFNVVWRHTGGTGEHSYTVSYACATGLSIAAPTPAGGYQAVQCNTPFNYINASSSMPLVATLADGTKSGQTTFSVAATKLSDKTVAASGTASTNVAAPATTAKTPVKTVEKPKSTAGTTYYPSGRTANLYGYSDLAVRITSAQSVSGNATVVFTISNDGTNVSPAGWSFNALLPMQGGYNYPVAYQQALYPGDRIVYTLRYQDDNTASGQGNPCNGWSYPCQAPTPTYGGPGTCNAYGPCNVPGYAAIPYGSYAQYNQTYSYSTQGGWLFGNTKTVTITVDPYNAVSETSKYNNTASQTYLAY